MMPTASYATCGRKYSGFALMSPARTEILRFIINTASPEVIDGTT
jgi:hypothetical protein